MKSVLKGNVEPAATDRARLAYAFYIHEIFMVLMTLSRAQQDLNCF